MEQASKGKSLIELMENLDAQLTYGGARRISEFEAELLDQLDESYDAQIKMQRDLEYAQRDTKRAQDTLEKIDTAISEYCTETTRNKILLARGWQFMPEKAREIEEALSDREIVEQRTTFLSDEIGKATVNTATESKDTARDRVLQEEMLLEQPQEIKEN